MNSRDHASMSSRGSNAPMTRRLQVGKLAAERRKCPEQAVEPARPAGEPGPGQPRSSLAAPARASGPGAGSSGTSTGGAASAAEPRRAGRVGVDDGVGDPAGARLQPADVPGTEHSAPAVHRSVRSRKTRGKPLARLVDKLRLGPAGVFRRNPARRVHGSRHW